jgi:glutaredoxin 3
VVYTTTWCPWCRKTLAWLDERGVDYVNKDIEDDPAHRDELLRKSGGTSIPVVEIDGELVRLRPRTHERAALAEPESSA